MRPFENLLSKWQKEGNGAISKQFYDVNLPPQAVATLQSLKQQFPRINEETLLREILNASLVTLEQHFPYQPGDRIVALDECGDEIYEDCGMTPRFLSLCREFQKQIEADAQSLMGSP